MICFQKQLASGLGLLAIVVGLVVPSTASAMTATNGASQQGRPVLLLEGMIKQGDGAKIVRTLKQRGFREVWLSSPGGSVNDGYQIGNALRRLGMMTRIPDGKICASSCVDVFLGGVVRFVNPSGKIIIHPGSISAVPQATKLLEEAVRTGQSTKAIQLFEQSATAETATWTRYLTSMGVSLDLVAYAAKVPHRCGIVLSRDELVYFNVVNTAGAPRPGYRPSNPRKIGSDSACKQG